MITALSNAPVVVQGPEVITSTTPGLGVSSSTAASQAAVSSNTTGTQTLYYPLDTPKYYMAFQIYQYQRQNLNTVGTTTPDPAYPNIVMPLPMQLVDTNQVNWAEMEVGTLPGVVHTLPCRTRKRRNHPDLT